MAETKAPKAFRDRCLLKIQTTFWISMPGLISCLFFQGLWFFIQEPNGAIPPITEPSGVGQRAVWMIPGIFWSTWLMIALFFGVPTFLASWLPPPPATNRRFVSRLGEMGVRLIGIPVVLFGLSVSCNFPARLLAGWTVFHYSLALISSMFAEYRMQYRTPA